VGGLCHCQQSLCVPVSNSPPNQLLLASTVSYLTTTFLLGARRHAAPAPSFWKTLSGTPTGAGPAEEVRLQLSNDSTPHVVFVDVERGSQASGVL